MIQPIGERILVKPLEVEDKTKSGIIVSTAEKEKKAEGEVIAVGSPAGSPVEVGDKVVYSKYAGEDYEVMDSGNRIVYKFLKFDEILAKIS